METYASNSSMMVQTNSYAKIRNIVKYFNILKMQTCIFWIGTSLCLDVLVLVAKDTQIAKLI